MRSALCGLPCLRKYDSSSHVGYSGEQRSRGLELSAAGQLAPNWRLHAGYALQEAERAFDKLRLSGRRPSLRPC